MSSVLLVLASGWKTARVDVLLFEYGGWVGWGGILTFMYLAYIRGCYAAATSLVRENLLVHTGGIDGMWKISKGAVSSSWSTRKDGAVNPQLLQGIRIWQWRRHHGNSTDFLSLTGRALSKPLEK